MKAVFYDSLGPAREVLRFGELPLPEAGPGEVRVRVRWSGVNPSDVKTRMGVRSGGMPYPRVIPHSDGMGVIDAVGPGVAADRIGQRVWLWNAARGRAHGTACEWLCLPQDQAVPLPAGVSGEAGACLGIPALTALHSVLMDGGVAGKTVLVQGGAGAVGHYAVQFASMLGAKQVLATASTQEKAALAREAGADDVVLYRSEPVAERVRALTGGVGVDRIIELDLAGNGATDLEMLRDNGECVVYGSTGPTVQLPFHPLIAKNIQLRFFIVYHLTPGDRARATAALTRMLERGTLQHNIGCRLPLEETARAHEMIEKGEVTGNLVLQVG
jgi:NADPH2:quinone reductase